MSRPRCAGMPKRKNNRYPVAQANEAKRAKREVAIRLQEELHVALVSTSNFSSHKIKVKHTRRQQESSWKFLMIEKMYFLGSCLIFRTSKLL